MSSASSVAKRDSLNESNSILDGRQKVTRIPPYRPGDWVKLKDFDNGEFRSDLSGAVRRVRSLTASIASPDQKLAVWRVHFDDGRCVEWHQIDRLATEHEARAVRR